MRQSGAIIAVVLMMTARPAEARQAVSVQVPAVEFGVGLTVNGLFHDVNAAPDCAILPAPCTHEHAEKIAGFGADVSLARNLNGHMAVAGDAGVFGYRWDQRVSPLETRHSVARVASFGAGPRISTAFFDAGTGDREPGRFFGQFLVGGEMSNLASLRPLVLVGAGADVLFPNTSGHGQAHKGRDLTLRLGLDYRLTPGSGRNQSGWRFVVGVVFGPHA